MALVVGTNSYQTAATATTYFNDSIRALDWEVIDSEKKDQLLITATRMIDRQRWQGAKTSEAQALAFPRTGLTDKEGNAVDSGSVPQAVIEAQAELAFALNNDASLETKADTGSNIDQVKAGPVAVSFKRPKSGTRFPVIVHELLSSFLDSELSLGRGLLSGGADASSFETTSPYALDRGL